MQQAHTYVAFIAVIVIVVDCFSFLGSSDEKSYIENSTPPKNYGVDVTFPIHHPLTKDSIFKRRYDDWITGCANAGSRVECEATERARLEQSISQPKMHHNYTEIGFKKMKVPDAIFKEIIEFYEKNKASEKEEKWSRGYTYVNYWDTPSYMVSLEDKQFGTDGWALKDRIWNGLNPILSEWIGGKEMVPTSMYGIRIYKRGAFLATHVDRMPLVTSCIVQVAQDVDEPWPVEIYDHSGVAHNVTLKPGEMAMYESHTTLHGRPFPLNGSFYANLFVHFKPVEYDDLLESEREAGLISGYNNDQGGHESDNHDDETLERHRNDIKREAAEKLGKTLHDNNNKDGRTQLHVACAEGSLDEVERLLKNSNTDMLNVADAHGWLPIHEAVRSGEVDLVKYLVDLGSDIGAITMNGGTPLWWVKRLIQLSEMGRPESSGSLENLKQVRDYLLSIGAPDEGNEAVALS